MKKYAKIIVFLVAVIVGLGVVSLLFTSSVSAPNASVSLTPDQISPTVSVLSQQVTISGEFVCLPHRDQSGPQTMECAFGLKTPEGMYYGLRDGDPTYKNISGIATGKNVTVTGLFEKREDKIYPTEGVIVIQSISQ